MKRRFPPDAPLGLARAGPGLADHARSVWQRKQLVALGLVAGVLLGVYAFPTVGAQPTYRATIRIDLRPLASTTLLAPAPGAADPGGTAVAGAEVSSPLQDVNTAAAVLRDLGPAAGRLSVVAGLPREQWAGALAAAIVPTRLPGSTQVDLSYTDRDPRLAGTVVQRYAKVFRARRNAADAALTKKVLAATQRRLDRMNRRVVELSARADRETDPLLRRNASTVTSTQLRLAVARWRTLADAYDAWNRQLLLLGPRTTVLTPAVVTQANRTVAGWVYLALGLVVGAMAGVGAALVAGAVQPKVATLDDLEQATRLAPVGSVPSAGFRRRRPLTVLELPFSPAAEGYRRVAAQLARRHVGDDVKVLATVSPDRREGKSTLTANLAYALARDRQVALVSGDLAKPDVERILGLRRRYSGLAELLADDGLELAALLTPVFENLVLLPAGIATTNPAELLASARLPRLVASLRELGFLVLIDTPPARSLADALHLANCADAVLLCARSGTSRVRSLEAVATGFESTRHRVLGGVLVAQRTGVISHHKTRRVGYRRSLLSLLLRTGLMERVSGLGQLHRARRGSGGLEERSGSPPVDTGDGGGEPEAQRDEGREVIGASSKDGPA
jgi:capsular exopolysaccharide synthesis family protein